MNFFNFRYVILIALFLFQGGQSVFAHRLHVQVKQVRESLQIEAFYEDDTPAQQGRVKLSDENNKVVAQALTDEKGRCEIALPVAGTYLVEVETLGHSVREKIKVLPKVASNPKSEIGSAAKIEPKGSIRPGDGNNETSILLTRTPEAEPATILKVILGFLIIAGASFVLRYYVRSKMAIKP